MAVQPTPSWLRSYAVIFTSLLAGASAVHNILKPDLTIPDLEKLENSSAEDDGSLQQVEMNKPATT